MMQRISSGEYVKYISDAVLFALCTLQRETISIKSYYYVKSILQSQFASSHNVIKFHVFNMTKRFVV